MKRHTRALAGVIAAATFGFSGAAAALPFVSNSYYGIGVSTDKYQDASAQFNGFASATGSTITSEENRATGGKIFIGHRYLEVVGTEVALVDLGKAHATYANGQGASLNAKGISASVLGIAAIPVFPVSLFAKAGLFAWQAQGNAGTNATASVTKYGVSPLLGAGINYKLAPFVTIRGEIEDYRNVGKADSTGRSNIQAASISGVFNF